MVHHELSVPDVTLLLFSVACWAIVCATGALLADLPGMASRANLEPFWGVGALTVVAVVRAHLTLLMHLSVIAPDKQLSWSGQLPHAC